MEGYPAGLILDVLRNSNALSTMAGMTLSLITGDRELEMLGRYEENAYLMRMMRIVGHKNTVLYELEGYGHNMAAAAFPLLLNEVHRIIDEKLKSEN